MDYFFYFKDHQSDEEDTVELKQLDFSFKTETIEAEYLEFDSTTCNDENISEYLPQIPIKNEFFDSKLTDDKSFIKLKDNEITEQTTETPTKKQTRSSRNGPKRKKLTDEEKQERLQLMRKKEREASSGICQICGIYYKSLNGHLRLHELKAKGESVECYYCNQILAHKLLLRNHFRKHFMIR